MYTGKRECKGCGRPGSEESRTLADELCYECKKALKIGYDIKENDDNRYAKISLAPFSAQKFCWNPGNNHKYTAKPPYLSESCKGKGSSKDLQNALIDFIKSLSIGKRPNILVKVGNPESRYHYTLPYKQGKMFFKFWDALTMYCKRLQKESFNEGKDLLKGLNTGKHTLEYFEERVERENNK